MSWFPVRAHALAQVLAPVPVLGDTPLPAPTSHTVFQGNETRCSFSSEENPPKAVGRVLLILPWSLSPCFTEAKFLVPDWVSQY